MKDAVLTKQPHCLYKLQLTAKKKKKFAINGQKDGLAFELCKTAMGMGMSKDKN